tara:strand:- start:2369 stop:2818 length:450 start_codon:yes stop_codon:yes gene_type:complete
MSLGKQIMPDFEKPKIRYDSNLLNLLGYGMFSNMEQNFINEKPLLKNIIPKQDDIINNLRFDLQFNPAPDYQFNFIKNRTGARSMSPSRTGEAFTWEEERYLDRVFERGLQGSRGNILPMPFSTPNDFEVHINTPMPGRILQDIKRLFK